MPCCWLLRMWALKSTSCTVQTPLMQHKKKHGKEKDREKERLLKEAKRFLKKKLKEGQRAARGWLHRPSTAGFGSSGAP